jgi:hypothetical protein
MKLLDGDIAVMLAAPLLVATDEDRQFSNEWPVVVVPSHRSVAQVKALFGAADGMAPYEMAR